MPTNIDDGSITKKPQWKKATTGTTTPDDVVGTLKTMFTSTGTREGGVVGMEFSWDAIAGAETGLIAIEKLIEDAYVRVKQIAYDSTGLTSVDGYAAGANALRGMVVAVPIYQDLGVRVRVSQTGGVAREILWTYALLEGLA